MNSERVLVEGDGGAAGIEGKKREGVGGERESWGEGGRDSKGAVQGERESKRRDSESESKKGDGGYSTCKYVYACVCTHAAIGHAMLG